ncbi:hypothetical protein P2318_11945 [Myxococcaceae bacterium GXIMD 01537]
MGKKSIQAGERRTAARDESPSLVSALYHLFKAMRACEQSLQEAEQAGDAELAQFFQDWRDEQRHFCERARNLLASRLTHARAGVGGVSAREQRVPTNASVKSGGNAGDDIVDLQSKESFPASDAPSSY